MKIINGKWKVLDETGGGGQAKILKVVNVQEATGQIYALKYLKSQKDRERRARMFHEVNNLQKLSHEHILKVVESNHYLYQSDEKLYYLCPFIDGCTLEEYVEWNRVFFDEAVDFFLKFCNALEYCHQMGIVHRDIKPDNIMLKNNNISDFVLIDFGLSFNKDLPQERLTVTDQQMGNRFLLLPELVSGTMEEKRQFVSDITLSCGVFLFLLTGIIPHSLVDGVGNPPHKREAIKKRLSNLKIDDMKKINLFSIFEKAFMVNVDDRYQTVAELIRDIKSMDEFKVNRLGGEIVSVEYGVSVQENKLPILKYAELIRELNPNPRICSPSGLNLPPVTNVAELMQCSCALKKRDQQKIMKYYAIGDFETSAEKVWTRAMSLLRNRILSLGEEFVADMIGVDDTDYVHDMPAYQVIILANDLGFIDQNGCHHLMRANEYYNYYINPDKENSEEMPQDEANIIIKNCVRYILYSDDDTYGLQFNDFREKLKKYRITDIFDGENLFSTAPYFYLKTTVRSLIKLFRETTGIEYENIVTNINLIIPGIWNELKTEERRLIADTYTDYEVENNKEKAQVLKDVLSKIHGFDYVKENVRSRTFIAAAKHLIDVHFGINNFYNEPAAICNLEELGTKFPRPALKECVTSILFVKLGNYYGVSWDADAVADRLLDRLTEDEWCIYLNNYLPEENVLLDCLCGKESILPMRNRWEKIVKKYDLSSLRVTDRKIQNLLGMKKN